MIIIFPITEKEQEFQLGYGLYNIDFAGGFSIEHLDALDIHLFNAQTKETSTLKEKTLKSRDSFRGQKTISCYEFQINDFGTYKIEIKNPEVLLMHHRYNSPFSLLKFIFPNPATPPERINLIIK
jgi:plastocyanin domain-containing protein